MRIGSGDIPSISVPGQGRAVFTLKPSSPGQRIDGSMPVWETPRTSKDHILQTLSAPGKPNANPALSLAEQPEGREPEEKPFGFLDLIDMVNPLHHIPLVGMIYRSVTGDTIKPISQIIGGAAFGGVLGAAAGIANVIVKEETGADIGQNIMAAVTGGIAREDPRDTTIAKVNLAYRPLRYNE